jgi:hypothetical protein
MLSVSTVTESAFLDELEKIGGLRRFQRVQKALRKAQSRVDEIIGKPYSADVEARIAKEKGLSVASTRSFRKVLRRADKYGGNEPVGSTELYRSGWRGLTGKQSHGVSDWAARHGVGTKKEPMNSTDVKFNLIENPERFQPGGPTIKQRIKKALGIKNKPKREDMTVMDV